MPVMIWRREMLFVSIPLRMLSCRDIDAGCKYAHDDAGKNWCEENKLPGKVKL